MNCPGCGFLQGYHPKDGSWIEYTDGKACPKCGFTSVDSIGDSEKDDILTDMSEALEDEEELGEELDEE